MATPNRLSADELCSTKVFVRIRPFNQKERLLGNALARSEGEAGEAAGASPPATEAATLTPTLRVDEQNASLITCLDPAKNYAPKETYVFERCFGNLVSSRALEDATKVSITSVERQQTGDDQALVYTHVGQPVLGNALKGYNGCVFTYGQTGSGKTFTMMGPSTFFNANAPMARATALPSGQSCVEDGTPRYSGGSLESGGVTSSNINSPTEAALEANAGVSGGAGKCASGDMCLEGIVPRLARDLFKALQAKREKDSSHSFRVELEYFEIYNEKVIDLLSSGPRNAELRVRNSAHGPYIENLTRKHVEDEQQIFKWLRRGNAERHTAATKMNDRSSRSHAILTLHLVQLRLEGSDAGSKMTSKLHLVDLAGSERTGASGVAGMHFKEATKINLSLTTLGRVIDALADLSQGKRGAFCPYRDSNLTWVLADSLGGNSKTTMIATVSPHSVNFEESCQTLRYASRAKQIITKVVVNEDPQVRQIKLLTAEVERLQRLLNEGRGADDEDGKREEYVEELKDRIASLEAELEDAQTDLQKTRAELSAVRAMRTSSVPTTTKGQSTTLSAKEVLKLRADLERLEKENMLLATIEDELKQSKGKLAAADRRLQVQLKAAEQEAKSQQKTIRRLERENKDLDKLSAQLATCMADLQSAEERENELLQRLRDLTQEEQPAPTERSGISAASPFNDSVSGISLGAVTPIADDVPRSARGKRSKAVAATEPKASERDKQGIERSIIDMQKENSQLSAQLNEKLNAYRTSQLEIKKLKEALKSEKLGKSVLEKRLTDEHNNTIRRLNEQIGELTRAQRDLKKANKNMQAATGESDTYVQELLEEQTKQLHEQVAQEKSDLHSFYQEKLEQDLHSLRLQHEEEAQRVQQETQTLLTSLQQAFEEEKQSVVRLTQTHNAEMAQLREQLAQAQAEAIAAACAEQQNAMEAEKLQALNNLRCLYEVKLAAQHSQFQQTQNDAVAAACAEQRAAMEAEKLQALADQRSAHDAETAQLREQLAQAQADAVAAACAEQRTAMEAEKLQALADQRSAHDAETVQLREQLAQAQADAVAAACAEQRTAMEAEKLQALADQRSAHDAETAQLREQLAQAQADAVAAACAEQRTAMEAEKLQALADQRSAHDAETVQLREQLAQAQADAVAAACAEQRTAMEAEKLQALADQRSAHDAETAQLREQLAQAQADAVAAACAEQQAAMEAEKLQALADQRSAHDAETAQLREQLAQAQADAVAAACAEQQAAMEAEKLQALADQRSAHDAETVQLREQLAQAQADAVAAACAEQQAAMEAEKLQALADQRSAHDAETAQLREQLAQAQADAVAAACAEQRAAMEAEKLQALADQRSAHDAETAQLREQLAQAQADAVAAACAEQQAAMEAEKLQALADQRSAHDAETAQLREQLAQAQADAVAAACAEQQAAMEAEKLQALADQRSAHDAETAQLREQLAQAQADAVAAACAEQQAAMEAEKLQALADQRSAHDAETVQLREQLAQAQADAVAAACAEQRTAMEAEKLQALADQRSAHDAETAQLREQLAQAQADAVAAACAEQRAAMEAEKLQALADQRSAHDAETAQLREQLAQAQADAVAAACAEQQAAMEAEKLQALADQRSAHDAETVQLREQLAQAQADAVAAACAEQRTAMEAEKLQALADQRSAHDAETAQLREQLAQAQADAVAAACAEQRTAMEAERLQALNNLRCVYEVKMASQRSQFEQADAENRSAKEVLVQRVEEEQQHFAELRALYELTAADVEAKKRESELQKEEMDVLFQKNRDLTSTIAKKDDEIKRLKEDLEFQIYMDLCEGDAAEASFALQKEATLSRRGSNAVSVSKSTDAPARGRFFGRVLQSLLSRKGKGAVEEPLPQSTHQPLLTNASFGVGGGGNNLSHRRASNASFQGFPNSSSNDLYHDMERAEVNSIMGRTTTTLPPKAPRSSFYD